MIKLYTIGQRVYTEYGDGVVKYPVADSITEQ